MPSKKQKSTRFPKKLRFQHLNMQISVYFSAIIILTFMALAMLIGSLFSEQLLREMDDVLNRKMKLIDSEMKSHLVQIQDLHATIINDNVIRTSLADIQRYGIDATSMARVQGQLANYAHRTSYITSIVAFDVKQNILHSYYSLPPYSTLLKNSEDMQQFSNSSDTRMFTHPNRFPLSHGADNNSITYLGRLYNPAQEYAALGTIAINLKTSFLFSALPDDILESFDACSITDGEGRVVYQVGREEYLPATCQETDSYWRVYKLPLTGYPDWQITCVLRQSVYQSPLRELLWGVVLVSLPALLFVIAVSFYIAKRITQPIQKLQNAMVALGEGQYPEKLEMRASGEIQDLLDGFNALVDNIKQLTRQIIDKQKQEKAHEVARLQTELDLLQLQINPHFIHNTLNSMKYMATTAKNTALAETITAFNALLRASMSSSTTVVTVLEEIANIENYLHLQRGRYDFPIDFHCQADEGIALATLPKLIVQPLVENALFHGIAPVGGGSIRLAFVREGDCLTISVSDDGTGMLPGQMQGLLEGTQVNPRGYSHIGLKNVNDRLALLYGQNSRLCVTSRNGKGTTISFTIPFTQ